MGVRRTYCFGALFYTEEIGCQGRFTSFEAAYDVLWIKKLSDSCPYINKRLNVLAAGGGRCVLTPEKIGQRCSSKVGYGDGMNVGEDFQRHRAIWAIV